MAHPHAPTVTVAAAALRHCGQQVRDVGRDLHAANAHYGRALTPVHTGTTGWASAAMAADTARAWTDRLRQLADQVSDTGAGMVTAADEYEASDRRALRRTGRALVA